MNLVKAGCSTDLVMVIVDDDVVSDRLLRKSPGICRLCPGSIAEIHRPKKKKKKAAALGLTDSLFCPRRVLQGGRSDAARKQVQRELLKFEVFETGGVELALCCDNEDTQCARRSTA